MVVGKTYPVTIVTKNTGTSTWTAAANYKLGAQDPADNSTWGQNRELLGASDSIAPGASKTFVFNVVAPSTPGSYNFQWQMTQEGVEWFGDSSTVVAVSVVSAASVANAQPCSEDGMCVSGICNKDGDGRPVGLCCNSGECAFGDNSASYPYKCLASGASANLYWPGGASEGICRSGIWKIRLGGAGCATWPCDQGTCSNNICSVASGKANGLACLSNGECASGSCINGLCAATCASLGFTCGIWSDGITTLNCGTCSSGQTCSAGGSCVAGSSDNSGCTAHSSKKCDSGDLYWFDSCGTKQELYQSCGSSQKTSNYQCSGNWLQLETMENDCVDGACVSNPSWSNSVDCAATGKTCVNNACAADNQAPTIYSLSPAGKIYSPKVEMSLTTSEAADCRFSTSDQGFDAMTMVFTSSNKLVHTATLSLSGYGNYDYYVRCKDAAGNVNATAGRIIFSYVSSDPSIATPPPAQPVAPAAGVAPAISNLSPAGKVNTSPVTLACLTDKEATCKFDTKDVAFGSMKNTMDGDSSGIYHSSKVELPASGLYDYFVRCSDSHGNKNTKSAKISFNYSATAPGPLISSPLPSGQVSQKDVALMVTTDKAATCHYGAADADFDSLAGVFQTLDGQQQTANISLPGPGSYNYYIRCADQDGNDDNASTLISFEYVDSDNPVVAPAVPAPVLSNPAVTDNSVKPACDGYKEGESDCTCVNAADCICDPDCPVAPDAGADPDCSQASSAKPQSSGAGWFAIPLIVIVVIAGVFAAMILKKRRNGAETAFEDEDSTLE